MRVYSRPNTGIIFAVFQGRIVGGRLRRDKAETLDIGFFAPDALPQQSAPTGGAEIDSWFFEVVSELLAQFKHKETAH